MEVGNLEYLQVVSHGGSGSLGDVEGGGMR